jgi:hypothetical protein
MPDVSPKPAPAAAQETVDSPATLLAEAEQHFPGITELVAVYGAYDQVVRDVQSIASATQPSMIASSSNSSSC